MSARNILLLIFAYLMIGLVFILPTFWSSKKPLAHASRFFVYVYTVVVIISWIIWPFALLMGIALAYSHKR